MTIYVPYGLIAIFISLYTFYTYNQKLRIRRAERHEHLEELREELINTLVELREKRSTI